MFLREFVFIIGILTLVIGLSQAIVPRLWMRVIPGIMGESALRIWGIVAAIIGALFILAVIYEAVGLSIFILVLGLLMLIAGLALVIAPRFMRNSAYGFFLNSPPESQLAMTRVFGIIRVLLGIAIIYAARI